MKMRSVASDELHSMMQRRMSQEHPSQASEAELAQRLQRLTILAVNRIIYQGILDPTPPFSGGPQGKYIIWK
jgi:hypothetical protein